jgi:hypothetical protein
MKRGGGPGRPASSDPLSGMSGQPDGGRLAGRVLAYLLNPGWKKKVPVKIQKSDKICVEVRPPRFVRLAYEPSISPESR